MNTKKVSVIVPLYNVERYVRECCDSIGAQDYDNLEVIFVDDCGSDGTMDILQTYLNENQDFPPCLTRHHEANRGLSAARNTGLMAATGDYVLFLDSDDLLTPSAISDLVQRIGEEGADVAMGAVQEIDENGGYLNKYSLEQRAIQDALGTYARGEWYVMAWNKLCSRKFLLDHGLWFEEGLLHEDMLWSLQLACSGPKMALSDRTTYLYRLRQASIMTSMSVEKDLQVHVQVFSKMKDFIKGNGLEKNKAVYTHVEGKKSQVLYSLLEGGYGQLFKQYYPQFHATSYISPARACLSGTIGLGYLARDFGYLLPTGLGSMYRRLFYNAVYNWRGKKIKDALWKKR